MNLPFGYAEFETWFDSHALNYLEPGRAEAVRSLKQLLDDELPERQRVRVRVRDGRVKSKNRTWRKLNEKYADAVGSPADVPLKVDDLVGLRIVCTNRSDLDRVVEILQTIDELAPGEAPVLAVMPDSVKDWLDTPKESGYRAYHVNLCTSVSRITDRHTVVCELQVRTLLQDSWGELTHEDTYKPGGSVPELVRTLSRRMADLMSTLDDIAQDLREELDTGQEVGVDEPESTEPGSDEALPAVDVEAAKRHLAEYVSTLVRPTALAALAWELQREFGQDIVKGWLGYGTFKDLLNASVPDARISPEPPSYVLPAGFDVEVYGQDRGIPRAISLLNDADRSFPLVSSDHWPRIYAALASATTAASWEGGRPDMRTLNELTRAARDAAAGGAPVGRNQVNYVANALRFAGRLTPDMRTEEVERAFVDWTVARASGMGLADDDLEDLTTWLTGGAEDA